MGQVFDAAYDHDPQLPGRKGVIQAIMGRLWSESRGHAVVAVALSEAKRPGEADDENQPAKKLQRIRVAVEHSKRRNLRDALTAQIELDQTEAKKRRLDKKDNVSNDEPHDNSAKGKKKGSAAVQGRVFEHRQLHASSKCEFNAISRILATSSGTSSSRTGRRDTNHLS